MDLNLLFNRLKNSLGFGMAIGDFKTEGPPEDEHPPTAKPDLNSVGYQPEFTDGWWKYAQHRPAAPGRVGPSIIPKTLVVHTTDMMPDSFDALVRAWTTTTTSGACAHFLIGRDEKQGVVQFVPINKNGNHAGGTPHGNYKLGPTTFLHPNTVAIGVELHGAGYLKSTSAGWLHTDSGRLVQPTDVYVDTHHRGFMVVTSYQLTVLQQLILALRLPGLPTGASIAPDASYASQGVADYAAAKGPTICGHVSLDPINKTDPGPQVMQWLRYNGYA